MKKNLAFLKRYPYYLGNDQITLSNTKISKER